MSVAYKAQGCEQRAKDRYIVMPLPRTEPPTY